MFLTNDELKFPLGEMARTASITIRGQREKISELHDQIEALRSQLRSFKVFTVGLLIMLSLVFLVGVINLLIH